MLLLIPVPLFAQVESIPGGPARYLWTSSGRLEGHLALNYSPEGAFSPDSSLVAVIAGEKIALFNLRSSTIEKVLHPHLKGVTDLDVQSANFISPTRLFLLGNGLIESKQRSSAPRTPELGWQWEIQNDTQFGNIDTVGSGGGFVIRYFPLIGGWVGLSKQGTFTLWNPNSGRAVGVTLPQLTNDPGLYEFSPDGHWLLLAQVQSGSPDPIVVRLSDRKFADVLGGHHGTVLSIMFSRDSQRVVTACEDGRARIFSVSDWKLLQTLSGHQGPVHWAEFSPNGSLVVSGGEDQTARVWSAADGRLEQTISEAQAPVLTVAFSPDGNHIAASTAKTVQLWTKTRQ